MGTTTFSQMAKGRKKPFAYSHFLEFRNLLMNSIKITNVDFATEKVIKSCLLSGCVGYDKITNKWAKVAGLGQLNEEGNPTFLEFVFPNGKTYQRRANYEPKDTGAYIIYATPYNFSFDDLIKHTTDFMDECDLAIGQNIGACKTPFVISVKDGDTKLTLLQAIRQKENGEPVIMVDSDFGDSLKVIDFKPEFMADKFQMMREDERDKLLNKLGIMSANTDKRERVQVGEVNATLAQCTDYLYLLIDTFNRQMQDYGLDFKMIPNSSTNELYAKDFEENEETEETTDIKEGEENGIYD